MSEDTLDSTDGSAKRIKTKQNQKETMTLCIRTKLVQHLPRADERIGAVLDADGSLSFFDSDIGKTGRYAGEQNIGEFKQVPGIV